MLIVKKRNINHLMWPTRVDITQILSTFSIPLCTTFIDLVSTISIRRGRIFLTHRLWIMRTISGEILRTRATVYKVELFKQWSNPHQSPWMDQRYGLHYSWRKSGGFFAWFLRFLKCAVWSDGQSRRTCRGLCTRYENFTSPGELVLYCFTGTWSVSKAYLFLPKHTSFAIFDKYDAFLDDSVHVLYFMTRFSPRFEKRILQSENVF